MDVSNWIKGNTHTHTRRSDGDATVEQAVTWYAEHRYDFLGITDHNCYLQPSDVPATLPDGFVLIRGSELSYKSAVAKKPLDVCALGGEGILVPDPPGHRVVFIDGGVAATLRAAVESTRSAGGLPIVCHPCYRWALSADDLLALDGDFLLEVFNPSSGCNTYGGGGADSPEQIWSRLLSAGRRVWAVAADDAHRIVDPGAPPRDGGGIGWVRVGAEERSADAILSAMRAGQFYASTGVELERFSSGPRHYSLRVRPVDDRKYTIRLLGADDCELATVHGVESRYEATGEEGFVRARIEDSEGARCWTQPWFVG